MTEPQRMSNADVAWLHMDQPTNLMVITGVLWFGEVPAWDRVREVIAERLVAPFPRFSQRVVEGGPRLSGPHWEEDPNFDLDLHLHRVALPAPGDRAALQALVADLTSTPLDHSRPLWQFHLVDGYEGGAAMIARIHHAIADGIALARVLLSLTDSSPDAGLAPAVEDAPSAGRARSRLGALAGSARGAAGLARGAAGAIAHESLEVARHPSHLVDIAATTRKDADVLAKALLPAPDPPSPLKGEMGVAKGVAWSAPIALEEVRTMGHETGTTINDIVVTAVAGALRRYLRSRDSPVEELTASVPFNLRPLDQPLPSELGNRFGLVLLRLPLGIGDRRRRLREVHRRMEEIKHSPEGAVSYGVLDAVGRTPLAVEQRLLDPFTASASAVVTNVPGPRQPVYLAGSKVDGVLVWAPSAGGTSTTVSIFSYDGQIRIGVMADAKLVPDPGAMVRAFEREVEALLRLKRRPIATTG